MDICAKKKLIPYLRGGHIYLHKSGSFYMYSRDQGGFFINMETGATLPATQTDDIAKLTDVTHKYCLQEK